MLLFGLDGELEQQQVERGAERRQRARGHVGGEGEIAGLGEAGMARDGAAVHEGEALVGGVGRDQRQAVAGEDPPGAADRRGRSNGVRGSRRGWRRTNTATSWLEPAAASTQAGWRQPPGGGRHHGEGQDVLHRDEAEIELSVEPRPGERRVVVEHADAQGRQPGAAQDRLAAVRAAGEAEGAAQGGGGEQQQAEAQVGPVEPVADPGFVDVARAPSRTASPTGAATRTAPCSARWRRWSPARTGRNRPAPAAWRSAARGRSSAPH